MEVFFGILVGVTLSFIAYKWFTRQTPTTNNTTQTGGGSSVNDGVSGELPKNNIK